MAAIAVGVANDQEAIAALRSLLDHGVPLADIAVVGQCPRTHQRFAEAAGSRRIPGGLSGIGIGTAAGLVAVLILQRRRPIRWLARPLLLATVAFGAAVTLGSLVGAIVGGRIPHERARFAGSRASESSMVVVVDTMRLDHDHLKAALQSRAITRELPARTNGPILGETKAKQEGGNDG